MPVKPCPRLDARSGRAPAARWPCARGSSSIERLAVVERLQELAQRLGERAARPAASSRSSAISSLALAERLRADLPTVSPSERSAGPRGLARTGRARVKKRVEVGRGALEVGAAAGSARRPARSSCAIVGPSSRGSSGSLLEAARAARLAAGGRDLGGVARLLDPARDVAACFGSSCADHGVGVGDEVLDDLVLVAEDLEHLAWSRAGRDARGGAPPARSSGRPARPVPSSERISRKRSR